MFFESWRLLLTDDPKPHDVVALLADRPAVRLVHGQVGTVVETLDGTSVLVEFCDDQGRAFAIEPVPTTELLVLRYEAVAA